MAGTSGKSHLRGAAGGVDRGLPGEGSGAVGASFRRGQALGWRGVARAWAQRREGPSMGVATDHHSPLGRRWGGSGGGPSPQEGVPQFLLQPRGMEPLIGCG